MFYTQSTGTVISGQCGWWTEENWQLKVRLCGWWTEENWQLKARLCGWWTEQNWLSKVRLCDWWTEENWQLKVRLCGWWTEESSSLYPVLNNESNPKYRKLNPQKKNAQANKGAKAADTSDEKW